MARTKRSCTLDDAQIQKARRRADTPASPVHIHLIDAPDKLYNAVRERCCDSYSDLVTVSHDGHHVEGRKDLPPQTTHAVCIVRTARHMPSMERNVFRSCEAVEVAAANMHTRALQRARNAAARAVVYYAIDTESSVTSRNAVIGNMLECAESIHKFPYHIADNDMEVLSFQILSWAQSHSVRL